MTDNINLTIFVLSADVGAGTLKTLKPCFDERDAMTECLKEFGSLIHTNHRVERMDDIIDAQLKETA